MSSSPFFDYQPSRRLLRDGREEVAFYGASGGRRDPLRKSRTRFRSAQQATESRLYLETIEAGLPGKKKLIIDKSQGRRHLLLLQDGIELPDGIRPLPQ